MASLNMPDVGESVTEGTVTRWLKQEGDAVVLDEPIVEIETEKVTVEVPSPFEGRLVKILVQEGEVAPVGAPLAEFETSDMVGAATPAPSNGAAAPRREPAIDQKAQSGTPQAGAKRAESGAKNRAGVADSSEVLPDSAGGAQPMQRMRRYSPVVLKLAAEHDIPLELVQGTGIEGRVTRQDVMRYIENPVAHTVPPSTSAGVVGVSQPQAPSPPQQASSTPDGATAAAHSSVRPASPAPPSEAADQNAGEPSRREDDDLQPLSATRRTIAQRMLDAHLTIPPAWMVVEADVTELVRLRESSREGFQVSEGVPLTYLPFFVQAVVSALKQHPAINATYLDTGITLHHRYHIGIAVAAESGLIVPVVRDADRKSIAGLARDIDELATKARTRRLGIGDVRGATFTIDNTGAFGSVISQPLIPPGQAAIITTEAIRRELRVAADGAFSVRSVMNLCTSFDHRALDGAQVGLFMRAVKESIEAIRADQAVP
ncbi:MAG: 2-oxo acid dehydrogenase subunit E2 [Chloroflexota bacterium]|nr:2-oxo acid dehydrogenase subunit E2 [Chloroflexota bacterium]